MNVSKMRVFRLKSLLLGCTVLATPLSGVKAKDKTIPKNKINRDWNILLITSDEHNPKIMGCVGHPQIKTPGIDRLASEGLLFTKAYCVVPVSAPTRQSMMTGLYAQEHGQIENNYAFDTRNKTWGNYFKQADYTTACIGKMHTNDENSNHGFDFRYSSAQAKKQAWKNGGGATNAVTDSIDKITFDSQPDKRLTAKVLAGQNRHQDGAVLDAALQYLNENRNNKFFLHVSFLMPHYTFFAPKDFYYMYNPQNIQLPKYNPDDLDDDILAKKTGIDNKWNLFTYEQKKLSLARYYASLSWMDYNVNQILNTLDSLGLAKHTLVIYTSDHGDMAAEKGLWLKNLMFDASARVPLIMRMPGVLPAGTTSDELISHIDYFPTFAGLTGAEDCIPEGISGKNLSKVILNKAKGRDYLFSFQGIPGGSGSRMSMVRSKDWKFILYNREKGNNKVLYDMKNDPDETKNLANNPKYSALISEFEKAINAEVSGMKKPAFDVRKAEKIAE